MNEVYSGSLVPAKVEAFTFEGDDIHVVWLATGDVGVVFRRLCEVVGVDIDAQARRLARARRGGATWATTAMMEVVAADGKIRVMEVLPRRSIPMWAAGLDLTRIKDPGARDKIAAYQDRAADVLAEAFIHRRLPAPPAPPVANVLPEWTEEGMRLRKAEIARFAADVCGPFVSPEVRAVIAAHGAAALLGLPVEKMLPALPEGEWLRPTQIAERAGTTAHAVGRAITALGLRGNAEHCKTIMDQKQGSAGQVPCYLYDAHAVGQIRAHLAEKGMAAA